MMMNTNNDSGAPLYGDYGAYWNHYMSMGPYPPVNHHPVNQQYSQYPQGNIHHPMAMYNQHHESHITTPGMNGHIGHQLGTTISGVFPGPPHQLHHPRISPIPVSSQQQQPTNYAQQNPYTQAYTEHVQDPRLNNTSSSANAIYGTTTSDFMQQYPQRHVYCLFVQPSHNIISGPPTVPSHNIISGPLTVPSHNTISGPPTVPSHNTISPPSLSSPTVPSPSPSPSPTPSPSPSISDSGDNNDTVYDRGSVSSTPDDQYVTSSVKNGPTVLLDTPETHGASGDDDNDGRNDSYALLYLQNAQASSQASSAMNIVHLVRCVETSQNEGNVLPSEQSSFMVRTTKPSDRQTGMNAEIGVFKYCNTQNPTIDSAGQINTENNTEHGNHNHHHNSEEHNVMKKRLKKRKDCQCTNETQLAKRRTRVTFTEDQIEALQKDFHLNKYLTRNKRAALAQKIGITEAQVKIWFQNQRMKWKNTTRQRLDCKLLN